MHLHFTVYGEEISSIRATERGWLPSCFRASASLLRAHKRALPALRTVRITIDADRSGPLAQDTLMLAGEDASAAWRPLEGALMEMRTLARVEVIVRDFGSRLNDNARAMVRSLVEEGLSGLLASHAGADSFFFFECRNY
ncbi:hypothetical protein OH76DRAFT_1408397 [Lentinus brumalis]|uniref:Uncharacterized protein n=1 Tax=Lentinus brumalis TaxID=2498619 RepID=A0A371CXV3_9APHY|nr:hypothetical protein OH76DRAFT_1408397 [Polyporus brumalis]